MNKKTLGALGAFVVLAILALVGGWIGLPEWLLWGDAFKRFLAPIFDQPLAIPAAKPPAKPSASRQPAVDLPIVRPVAMLAPCRKQSLATPLARVAGRQRDKCARQTAAPGRAGRCRLPGVRREGFDGCTAGSGQMGCQRTRSAVSSVASI